MLIHSDSPFYPFSSGTQFLLIGFLLLSQYSISYTILFLPEGVSWGRICWNKKKNRILTVDWFLFVSNQLPFSVPCARSPSPHAFLIYSEFPVFPLILAARAAFFICLGDILFCKTNIIFMGKRDYYSLYMPFPYFYWILSSPFASRTLGGGREATGFPHSGEGEELGFPHHHLGTTCN